MRDHRCTAIVVGIIVLLAACSTLFAQTAGQQHIRSITVITEVLGDGQKLTAVALEYDKEIDNSKLTPSIFSVEGRTITNVYAATAPVKSTKRTNGKYVLIELSPTDSAAALFAQRGRSSAKVEAKAAVTQTGSVTTIDGVKYGPSAGAMLSDRVRNEVVDDFRQAEYKDPKTGAILRYNLFVPRQYDARRTYPLVLFMHDAGATSTEPTRTLVQGLGAVIWATPAEQAKHACFVLAPQYSTQIVNDNSEASEYLDTTIDLVELVASQFSIDKDRIYTTGQSGGCMMSIAMGIKYPGFLAAMMLVAGQWDAEKSAVLAKDKLWIVVSEGDLKAFPGMNAITATLEREGAKVSRAVWDGQSTPAQFAAAVSKMAADGSNVKYSVLKKGTVVPPGMADDGGSNHICTWRIAYTIEGVRDWLFGQQKSR